MKYFSLQDSVFSKGFTLIELLVVIAIIGILSSIVIGNINQARQKGNDAAIKAEYQQMRTAGELYYSNYGTYGGALGFANTVSSTSCQLASTVFNSTDGFGRLITNAESNSDQSPTWVSRCALGNAANESWAVSIPLKTGQTWCVDSTGYLGVGTSTGGGTGRAYCQ